MKKMILLTICTALLLSGCSSKESESEFTTEITETSNSATEMTTTEFVIETTEEPTEWSVDMIRADTWQKGYIEYINRKWDGQDWASFSLIYIDDDNIPELFIDSGSEAGGEYAISFQNGKIKEHHFSRLGTKYIEHSGLMYTDTGHMGVYPVKITQLKNGEFTLIGEGSHNFKASDKSELGYALDENGQPISEYIWENKNVSEDEFYQSIDSIFDREQGKYPTRWYIKDEMISILKTGKHISYGNRYELIQADVSWDEAQQLCKEKGGYLATITSPDEQDVIKNQIEDEDMRDINFYVGYISYGWEGDEFIRSVWVNADGSITPHQQMIGLYCSYAADYDYKNEIKIEGVRNNRGLIKYSYAENQVYLHDVPENLLENLPEYEGKIGYICEYDNY